MKHTSFIIACLVALLAFSCSKKDPDSKASSQLNIVATTGMIYDAAINIGKDRIKASALMGTGVDPHLYKATQGDLKKLREADLVFYNGLHLEGKMGEVFEKLSRIKKVKAVSEGIPDTLLRENEQYPGTFDPHIWFDIKLWSKAVESVGHFMMTNDSINTSFYQTNMTSYLNQLDSLNESIKISLSEIPVQQKILITAHDAFGYFGDAYDIQVKGLQGISTLSEPGLKDITQLVNLIVKNKVKAVFIETSVSQKAINAVVEGCKQKNHEVIIGGSLYSDAMGELNQFEGTYIGMFHMNVQTIVNALK